MIKIKFLYKVIFYVCITLLAIMFYGLKIFAATAPQGAAQPYTVLDVSKINITPEDIKNILPNPFTEIAGQTPPAAPAIPGQPGAVGTTSIDIQVLGTLPPDVVILKRNGKTLTCRSGDNTWMGKIGQIYIDGAWVNNVFIPLMK